MQVETIRGSPRWIRRRWSVKDPSKWHLGVAIALASCLAGCESNDDRLVTMATENAQRQAEQSQDMARLQQQVAEGTKQLVASEADARRAWAVTKHDLQADFAEVGKQRDALETERRAIAVARHRDPILAAAIETLAMVLACLIPLAAAVYAFWQSAHAPVEPTMATILLDELTACARARRTLPPPTAKPPLVAPDDELPF